MRDFRLFHLNRRGWTIVFVLLALLIGMAGYWVTMSRVNQVDGDMREAMQEQAMLLAQSIDPEYAKALSFTSADSSLAQFQLLERQLRAYHSITSYRGIYTLALRKGTLYFGPESYSEDDPDTSPPGTPYLDPSQQDIDLFQSGQSLVEGPANDEYGTFVSALSPVADPRTGQVIMLVGIDLEASDWQTALNRIRWEGLFLSLILTSIPLIGIILIGQRDHNLSTGHPAHNYLEAYMIAAFGLALTLMLAQLANVNEERSRDETFRQLAESKLQVVAGAFYDLQNNHLDALTQFFENSEQVTRQEFDSFTASMLRKTKIQAATWIQPIPEIERSEWEARARQEGLAGFAVWELVDGQPGPAASHAMHYVNWYIEPIEESGERLGFDVSSEPIRWSAVQAAINSGLDTATDPITLLLDPTKDASLAFNRAVFRNGALEGIASISIHTQSFLQSILPQALPNKQSASVSLFELEAGQLPAFLASTDPQAATTDLEMGISRQARQGVYPLLAFDRAFAVVVGADEAFLDSYPRTAFLTTSLMGIFITAIVVGFVLYLADRRLGLESEVKQRTRELESSRLELMRAYDATMEGWSRALELRDQETEGHTERVTKLTLQLAQAMHVTRGDLANIRRGALLHDIGKIGIADSILRKPGKLTADEWKQVRKHPEAAYNLLSHIDYLMPALDIPYCHHEKWDGTGYPGQLKGEQIPLSARIFAVADVYDALTSNRPYRKAWSHSKAIAYIQEQRGKHFDPQVVDTFLKLIEKLRAQHN